MAVRVPRLEVWGDESGNLDFDPKTGSKYFVVSTMTVGDPHLTTGLLDLRRELDRRGFELPDGFHATEDKQAVRDEVFKLLTSVAVRADFTYYTKAQVYPRIQSDPDYFYRWSWFYHLRHVLPKIVPKEGELFVGIATLGIKKKRQLHAQALREVVAQCLRSVRPHCAHWSAPSHPCLQAADYYTWAVGRWLESGDDRSLKLIRPQIRTLYRFI
jgi:Protein of unknown function (DUF3800)